MIEIKNLYKSFGDKVLFNDFSLTINDGEFVIFAGNSGCGKTTLLNMIGTLEPIGGGQIVINGKQVTNKKKQLEFLKYEIGFLFQNFALLDNKTVKENLKIVKADCRTKISIEEALEIVGLERQIHQKVYQLSGGEQQRVALARLMVKKCEIVLADEPTGSLDKNNAEIVFSLLEELNHQGKTVIVVTHDESLKQKGKRVILL